MTVVQFSDGCGFEKNFDCLFERAPHQGTSVSSVNTMTRDGCNTAPVSHDIDEESKMTVVDVRTVKSQHLSEFSQERGPGCLDAKHINDLPKMVGIRAFRVDALNR